ncbi:MAG: STAS domain-containing protein [Synechococcaceae cyanobacterium]|nr:STAS domain-containing protein [Synechococcaceae cyanobacterium]
MSSATIHHEDGEDGVRTVTLGGRLDMLGVNEIALRFTSLTAARSRRVVVDLRPVTFLASIGIRTILNSARAQASKGGKLVLLLGSNELVRSTLETTGIGEVIPMLENGADAHRQALG